MENFRQFQHAFVGAFAVQGLRLTPDFDLKAAAQDSSLVVNATPIGMHAGEGLPLPKDALHKGLFVYDIVYNRPTELVFAAKNMGLKACNGLGMLLNQGVLAFEIWTGKKAPVKIMHSTLLKQLGGIA